MHAATGPLDRGAEAALRFLAGVGQATSRQLELAAHQATRAGFMQPFPLEGFIGMSHVGHDLRALGLAEPAADGSAELQITKQGTSLLGSIDRERRTASAEQQPTDEAEAIVGVPSEPVVYASILTELARLEDVLFVDPFLAAVDLAVLQQIGTITRALTGPRLVADRGESGDRATLLAIAAGQKSELEVRVSRAIHDRYALPRSGGGLMLGGSLGGRKVTTVIRLSAEVTRALRTYIDPVWDDATRITPIQAPDVPTSP